MPSIKNWWAGEIDWSTPAGQLLQKFLVALPKDRPFHFTLYGSAPLQLTVDRQLMSGAEVSGLLVCDDRVRVTIGFQELPDHFVERDGIRAGQISHAVQRLRNCYASKVVQIAPALFEE